MNAALILSALLMGLGGAWHCALMCGPLCAARPGWGLMVGRSLGYAAVGATLASAASWGANFVVKGGAGPWSPWLTVWAFAHAASLCLGIFLVWRGRQPLWLTHWAGAAQAPVKVVHWARTPVAGVPSAALGLAWGAMPCGLLQSAWILAALAPDACSGAAVMLAFSLSTAPALMAAPRLIGAIRRRYGDALLQARLTRLSGLLLAGASAWALGHGLWVHVRDVC